MPDDPGQPPKKRRTALWIVLGVVGVLILGASLGEEDTATTPSAPNVTTNSDPAPEIEITAAMIVDVMGSDTVDEFCTNYFLIGDYDMAFAGFSQGYNEPDPSAEEVFDELLTRC